jgi:hypothetical protein
VRKKHADQDGDGRCVDGPERQRHGMIMAMRRYAGGTPGRSWVATQSVMRPGDYLGVVTDATHCRVPSSFTAWSR